MYFLKTVSTLDIKTELFPINNSKEVRAEFLLGTLMRCIRNDVISFFMFAHNASWISIIF